MRLIFKIFALPFLLVLSLLAAVLMFLYDVAGWFLSLASGILAVIAVGLFVLQHQPVGGVYKRQVWRSSSWLSCFPPTGSRLSRSF